VGSSSTASRSERRGLEVQARRGSGVFGNLLHVLRRDDVVPPDQAWRGPYVVVDPLAAVVNILLLAAGTALFHELDVEPDADWRLDRQDCPIDEPPADGMAVGKSKKQLGCLVVKPDGNLLTRFHSAREHYADILPNCNQNLSTRQVLRWLLVGRLECEAFDEGQRVGYRFKAWGSYAPLLPVALSTPEMVTPGG